MDSSYRKLVSAEAFVVAGTEKMTCFNKFIRLRSRFGGVGKERIRVNSCKFVVKDKK